MCFVNQACARWAKSNEYKCNSIEIVDYPSRPLTEALLL